MDTTPYQFGFSESPSRRSASFRGRFSLGILLSVLCVGCSVARAQDQTPRLSKEHAQAMYELARKWVDNGAVSSNRPEPVWVRGCNGVAITLRFYIFANKMGYGEATVPLKVLPGSADDQNAKVDIAALTHKALKQALAATKIKIIDSRKKAGQKTDKPIDMVEYAKKLLVDIQIAKSLEPIRLSPGAPLTAVNYAFAGGFHGLCMGRKAGNNRGVQGSWVWPASQLAMNIRPEYQVGVLLRALGYDARDREVFMRLGRPNLKGIPLARFEVFHIVQQNKLRSGRQLIRGHVVVKPKPFNKADMEGMSMFLAEHLVHRQRKNGSMAGLLHPTTGLFEPASCEPREQALAAYALGRQAALRLKTDPNSKTSQQARRVSREAIEYLLKGITTSQIPPDPSTLSLMLMTIVESPHLTDMKEARRLIAENLRARCDPESGAIDKTFKARDEEIKILLPTQTLILNALSSYYQQTLDSEVKVKSILDKSHKYLWKTISADTQQVINHLPFPWLIEFEQRMWKLNKVPVKDADRVKRAKLFAELIGALRRKQITRPPEQGPADVIGGFQLRPQPDDTAPNPSWRSAVIMASMTHALKSDDLTKPADKIKWVRDCQLACRFLAQLMIDEPGCYYVRGPEDAKGGVRLNLWDNKLAVWPSAMTLLAVTELQEQMAAQEGK